jgi:hypothetical protein
MDSTLEARLQTHASQRKVIPWVESDHGVLPEVLERHRGEIS